MPPKLKIGRKKKKAPSNTGKYALAGAAAFVVIFLLMELLAWRSASLVRNMDNKCDVCRSVAAVAVTTMNTMFEEKKSAGADKPQLESSTVLDAMCTNKWWDHYEEKGFDGEIIKVDRSTAQAACHHWVHVDTEERYASMTYRETIDQELNGGNGNDEEKHPARRMTKQLCVKNEMCTRADMAALAAVQAAKDARKAAFEGFVADAEKVYEERYPAKTKEGAVKKRERQAS